MEEDGKYMPNLAYTGSTWDAKHLTNFLSSNWGDKLFNTVSHGTPSKLSEQHPLRSIYSTIKPSISFVSQPRSNDHIPMIDKPLRSSLLEWVPTKYSQTLTQPNLIDISSKLSRLDQEKASALKEYSKVLSPSKRRLLFEAEKHRNYVYSELKHQRLLALKKKRIIEGAYPSGVLGVDSPSRLDNSPYYSKFQKDNAKSTKDYMAKRVNRAKYLMMQSTPSPNIQFFNDTTVGAELERPRGLRRVEELPQVYHDTHSALFVSEPTHLQPLREKRLQNLWRGNRDFNIISGVQY